MEKLKNLSLRKTIVLYMVINIFCCYFLYFFIMQWAHSAQVRIWSKYTADGDAFNKTAADISDIYRIVAPRPVDWIMSEGDRIMSEACDFLQTYTILVLSVVGSCVAVILFYRNKMKTPMEELNLASKRIAENDLDFKILYENRDEMGRLCREFERMREQLQQNNRILWKQIEEEKALRAAIAHDIRSPLSVLKGYQEMLLKYVPAGTITMQKTVEMLDRGMKQIERMDVFVETMRKMGSLEQRKLLSGPVTAGQLQQEIQAEADILAGGKKVLVEAEKAEAVFLGDKAVILEVVENLVSNALRYAEVLIEVKISVSEQELKICVTDDGIGFLEIVEKMRQPFETQNTKDSLKHAGLGLYVSRLYCEKHGGALLLENNIQKGAAVTAVFHRIA